ncbi:AI-2E family transporter [Candidatus Albibeggiatoa sp. nov. NOAA]|uniref:AI-2E family transporter n=1 Tax=Candidatus Albibeggiatoa sp. nov. NOAA TaxID=3162724 RepID=UPI0032F5B989|nr:AI-2E family transporter [Thiotrichaceae bacterium]
MINVLSRWFNKYFSDPQAVLLAILLVGGFTVIMTMSQMLAPVLASMIIAYMLEGIVKSLEQHIPRFLAVFFVYMTFMTLLTFILLVLLPLLYQQTSQFIQELPTMIAHGHQILLQLPERYPDFVTVEQVGSLINSIRSGVRNAGQSLLSYSLASIPILITVLVYFILVPLLVFFFLKDKKLILSWLVSFLPKERHVANRLWREMDAQMGNYIRGKVYEIFIVGTASYITFAFMGLNYTPLLAVLVGLSVIIPYVGATLVTLPVVVVAYFQWGWSSEFIWVISAYGIIQALDGNVLVPLLFSEAVNLHPVAIIVAVLVFGGMWGVWGVFFAIPLATLVKALLRAWPRAPAEDLKL